jgi:dipeptidyl aminopeptidase/acylaminoacyl peptidase
LFLLALLAVPQAAPRAGGGGHAVVFAVDRGIVLAAAPGSASQRVPVLDGHVEDAAPSPDGRLLASVVRAPRRDEGLPVGPPPARTLVVAERATGRVHWRSRAAGAGARWSPDGTALAFATSAEAISVVDAAGHVVRRVAANAASAFAWSPDGRALAFAAATGLARIDLASGAVTALAADPAAGEPAWSPDGQTIAFASAAGLSAVPAAGGTVRLLAAGAAATPAWSPDARQLAFARGPSLWVVGAGGDGLRRLTRETRLESSSRPAWSPDGTRIAYVRARLVESVPVAARVRVVDAAGTRDRAVLPGEPGAQPVGSVAWTVGPVAGTRQLGARTARAARTFRSALPLSGLAVDDGRAATLAGGEVLAWSPGKRTARVRVACDAAYDVALARDRVAAVCFTPAARRVVTATVARPAPEDALTAGAEMPVDLAAGGSLLVASSGRVLTRLDHATRVAIRTYPRPVEALDVDDERVLVSTGAGSLEVVSGGGRTLARIRDPHRGGAVLAGLRVVTLDAGRLVVRGLSGRVVLRRELPPDAELHAADGELVVYSSADRLHLLRLADGRAVALRLPGQSGPALARLSREGLFVASTALAPRPGVLSFVPAARLDALLR